MVTTGNLHYLMNSQTIQGKRKMKIRSDCETEDDNVGQGVVPKIKSYKEVIVALEDVLFLKHEAMSPGSTTDAICTCRNASTVQTTLDSFLSRH